MLFYIASILFLGFIAWMAYDNHQLELQIRKARKERDQAYQYRVNNQLWYIPQRVDYSPILFLSKSIPKYFAKKYFTDINGSDHFEEISGRLSDLGISDIKLEKYYPSKNKMMIGISGKFDSSKLDREELQYIFCDLSDDFQALDFGLNERIFKK